jgi:ParB-like chromosome segregation protein Spo0J
MAKFSPKMAAIKEDVPSSQRSTMNVTEIKQVSAHKLHINPSNAEFFPLEDEQRFEQLKNDIRERGIIVPLLAKKDDTLLAGHNRLRAALELGLEYVPVQYVQEQLSEEQEREFLIKDNLLRRQFSGSEWIAIYRKLYPDFDQRIAERKRGGDTTNNGGVKEKQRDIVPLLTVKKIAEDTGQTEEAVKKQIQREKRKLANIQSSIAPSSSTSSPLHDECKTMAQDIAQRVSKTSTLSAKKVSEIHKYLEKALSLLSE